MFRKLQFVLVCALALAPAEGLQLSVTKGATEGGQQPPPPTKGKGEGGSPLPAPTKGKGEGSTASKPAQVTAKREADRYIYESHERKENLDGLTAEENSALTHYSGPGYDNINKLMRGLLPRRGDSPLLGKPFAKTEDYHLPPEDSELTREERKKWLHIFKDKCEDFFVREICANEEFILTKLPARFFRAIVDGEDPAAEVYADTEKWRDLLVSAFAHYQVGKNLLAEKRMERVSELSVAGPTFAYRGISGLFERALDGEPRSSYRAQDYVQVDPETKKVTPRIGNEFVDPSFMSTSTNNPYGRHHQKKTPLSSVLLVMNGVSVSDTRAKGIFFGPEHCTALYADEAEVLLAPNHRVKITRAFSLEKDQRNFEKFYNSIRSEKMPEYGSDAWNIEIQIEGTPMRMPAWDWIFEVEVHYEGMEINGKSHSWPHTLNMDDDAPTRAPSTGATSSSGSLDD